MVCRYCHADQRRIRKGLSALTRELIPGSLVRLIPGFIWHLVRLQTLKKTVKEFFRSVMPQIAQTFYDIIRF